MRIEYADAMGAWEEFSASVHSLIPEQGCVRVAEIGAGANPLLNLDFVTKHQLDYHVLDVSAEELGKADPGYRKQVVNMETRLGEPAFLYDFVFAQMTMEHIKDPFTFYSNVYKILRPGGKAFFFFACATSLPFFANLLLPEWFSQRLLLRLQPFRKHEKHGKFRAYYKWCLGPVKKNIRRIQRTQLAIEVYKGYFGHSYYQHIPLLQSIEKKKTRWLLQHPNPHFCSYSHLLVSKPQQA